MCWLCVFAHYNAQHKRGGASDVFWISVEKTRKEKMNARAVGRRDGVDEGESESASANACRRSVSALSGGFTAQVCSHQSRRRMPKTTLCLAAICTAVHTN